MDLMPHKNQTKKLSEPSGSDNFFYIHIQRSFYGFFFNYN